MLSKALHITPPGILLNNRSEIIPNIFQNCEHAIITNAVQELLDCPPPVHDDTDETVFERYNIDEYISSEWCP